jgi:capsular polysaccharide biosynthesis protein
MNFQVFIAKAKKRIRRTIRQVFQYYSLMPEMPLCENLIMWAPSRGYITKRIHDPFVLDYPLPASVLNHPYLNAVFQVVNGVGYSSQHLTLLPDAIVIGNRNMVVFDHNCFIVEGHWRSTNIIHNPIYRNEWPVFKKRKLDADWYCIMGRNGWNYYHFLWDELPKLFSALPFLPQNVRFLIPDDITDWGRDALQALGITPDKCLMQSCCEESQVERLWFATPLGHSDHASTAPDIAHKLCRCFIEKYGSRSTCAKRRIFISRVNSRYRRLLNESDLKSELNRLGFEFVFAENLKFSEQVRLFSESAIILAQHGAGLTNMMFAPPGCRILEIHGPDVTRIHYWMMASILGHKYDCIVGDSSSNTAEKGEPDFLVDINQLCKLVNKNI